MYKPSFSHVDEDCSNILISNVSTVRYGTRNEYGFSLMIATHKDCPLRAKFSYFVREIKGGEIKEVQNAYP
jgi:hypothetical protein